MENYRSRLMLALAGILLAVVWVFPNLIDTDKVKWWPSKAKLNYGLDIQGGLHLVMGADVDGVVAETTQRMVSSLKEEFKKENIQTVDVVAADAKKGEISAKLSSAADREHAEKYLKDRYSTTLQIMKSDGDDLQVRYYDVYLNDVKEKVIQQAIETIRNRIDEFGVAEPSISSQGTNRILVQLPGMGDAEKAKELISATARLDFMIADESVDPATLQTFISEVEKTGNFNLSNTKYSEYVNRINEGLKGKIPAGTVVYFEKAANAQKLEAGAVPMLLKTDSDLTGKDLDNAFISYGQHGEPNVSLHFNGRGANRFGDLTGANKGKAMAIVLDKIVKTNPRINERIGGGSAVITLNGRDRQKSLDEAKMISTTLRAGALPASLEQMEERRVGPSLGADSIHKAKIASFLGALIVVIFMLVYYKAMGLVATICLAINILCVFALLTSFGATLTLPGIAGIALTVGVAVDANVLINERIKEELRKGSSFKSAMKEGYHRAMSAILDSNITTAATALILLYFGTGPVRGFAITLLIGIATTLFSNVFVSKILVDSLIEKFGVKKLSI